MECLYFEKKRNICQRILLIYDISDNKKRNQFAKLMESYGIRVQKSAFEMCLSHALYRMLLSQLDKMIDQETDDVRIYALNENTLKYGKNYDEIIRADIIIA